MGKGIVKLGEGQWAVKDGNLLAAKETNGRFKNTEFTVSRGTRASYVGRDGLIKESNLQDVNLVNNGDFSELGSELVTSTSSTNNWINARANSVISVVGDTVRATTGTNDTFGISTAITTVIGKTYKINSFGATNNSSGSLIMRVSNGANLSPAIYQDVTSDDLTLTTSASFVATATTTYIGFLVTIPVPTGEDYVETNLLSVKEVDPNDYWTVTNNDADNYVEFTEGFARLKFLNTSPITMLNSVFTLEANKTYKLVVDVHDVTSGAIKIDAAGLSELFNTEGVTTRYLTPTGNTTLSFYRATADVDITLASVSLQEVKTDTPRIDFTDNTDGHLLLEPQSTNLVTHSEDFTDSSWTKLGAGTGSTAIVTPNYAISPDGTQNASRLQCDLNGGGSSSSNQSLIYDLYSSSGNQTLSIYVKSNTGSNQTIYLANTQTSGDTITVTNEWQRFEFNYSSSLYVFAVGLRGRSGGAIDDTADVLIWAAQAEALSHSTSYIPTNGSTVTRDAETCTGAGSSADFNSEEGVLYLEIAALADDISQQIGVYGGSSTEQLRIEIANSVIRGQLFNGAYQANMTSIQTVTNFNKIAFKWKVDDFALWVNGSEIQTDSSGTTFSAATLDNINFLAQNGTSSAAQAKVKALRVYKEALSDTDLENLTS